jgi:hypothetical protein
MTIVLLVACAQPGDLPIVVNANPAKGIEYEVFGIKQFRPIEMVCYIDTDKYNPLNAMDYTLKYSGIRFFDYVILGGAFIKVDSKGFYIDLSENLKGLLARRNKYVVPLQENGIRVLLGIQSSGRASFGQPNEDQMYVFAAAIYGVLQMYGLDGVEFYDSSGKDAHPDLNDFDPDNPSGWKENQWLLEEWKEGGSNFNNFFYGLRELYYRHSPVNLPEDVRRDIRDTPPLFLREFGYGRFIPERVWCTDGFADFVGSVAEITYSFNPFFDRFPVNSSLKNQNDYQYSDIGSDNDNYGFSWMLPEKYGPLAIDLDGGGHRNIWYPFIEKPADEIDFNADFDLLGAGIDDLYRRFKNGSWRVVYFNNLKPNKAAEGDPYYRWLAFDDSKPVTPFLNENGDWAANHNPAFVPMSYIFSELSVTLFGEDVVCSYGEYVKDW